MREYTKKPESQSRPLDSNPKAFKQAPIDVILQRYKERNIQRYAEDEELIQGKFSDTVQREEFDEDELLQGKFDTVQREGIDEDELLQGKFETSIVQREEIPPSGDGKANKTDIPDNLKNDIEAPSGYSMDDVRVHYNSPKAAQLQALAYAQGTDIHVAPEQKQHLPHEACYVVQQKQGRVQPTMQLQGVNVNDNGGLEKEADVMGGKAVEKVNTSKVFGYKFLNSNLIQRKIIVNGTVYPYGENLENLNYSKREFRKLLILSLQCFKYKETGTRAMWNRINTWLADEDDSEERTFKDWEELTSKLWDDNLLTRVMSGPSMGPKNLGNRPSFTSDVIKQFPVGFGQHRRHIISSSTLGKAIEKGYEYLKSEYTDNKNQVLITLNEWLTRNHETVKTTEYSALRAIWTHVHNHSGNIWVGDGKWNSAIGLIRGSLTSLLSRLNGYESVSTVVLVQEIEKIEPIYNGISIPWNELIQTLSDAVKMSNPVLSPISLNIAYTKWSEEIESIFNGDTDYNESQKVYEELDKAIPESNFISLSHVLEILDRLKNKPSKFFKKEYFPIYRKWIIESSIPNEKISKFKAREIIQEWILNCDLDYPQTLKPEHKDEYFDELCAVYSGLLNPTFHLFDENDILDRYLNLYYDKSIR